MSLQKKAGAEIWNLFFAEFDIFQRVKKGVAWSKNI